MIDDDEIRLVAKMCGFDGPEDDTGEALWSGNFYALKCFAKTMFNAGFEEKYCPEDK